MRGQPLVNGSVTVVMIDLLMRFLEKMKRARTVAKGNSNHLSDAERGEVSLPKTSVVPDVPQGPTLRGESASSIMDEAFLINNAVAYEEGPFRARVAYPTFDTSYNNIRQTAPSDIPEVVDINRKECTGWTAPLNHSVEEWPEVTVNGHSKDSQHLRSEGRYPADHQVEFVKRGAFEFHKESLPAPVQGQVSVNCLGTEGPSPFPRYESARHSDASMTTGDH